MEKAKLTKQQAEAIEIAQEDTAKERIVAIFIRGESRFIGNCEIINEFDLDTLIRALYIGYEVEKTEQEIMQEIWDSPLRDKSLFYYRQGIIAALSMAGRKDLIPQDKS